MRRLIIIILSILLAYTSYAQILVTGGGEPMLEDSVKRDFSNQPYFGMYKDNYFIFGPSVGPKPTKENTNIKFQISIAQRLTQATLPWGTYLYLFYTQKCFWNILENSMPMTDLNSTPGKLMVPSKLWAPIVDGENNRDIVDYCGWCQFGTQVVSDNRRFTGGITIVPRRHFGSCNVVIDFAMRLFKKENQYLFFQFYNGYGEGLLDYNKYHSQIRVGLLIRPKLFSDF